MRRLTLLLVLAALVLAGCGMKGQMAQVTAGSAISAGDKLTAKHDYDGAIQQYLTAVKAVPEGPLHEEALRKAGNAITAKIARMPLRQQVAELRVFVGKMPGAYLPLSTYNWLCGVLRTNAEAALSEARVVASENDKIIGTYGMRAPARGRKPAPAKPASPKAKTAAKPNPKPGSSGAATATATATAATTATATATKPATLTAVVATKPPTPVAAVATASPVAVKKTATPTVPVPSPADLTEIASALPVLGQPPAAKQLFLQLADIQGVMARCKNPRTRSSAARLVRPAGDLKKAIASAEKLASIAF